MEGSLQWASLNILYCVAAFGTENYNIIIIIIIIISHL